MTPEHQKLVKEWSVRLMRRLYDERPRFCDVAIECIPARRPGMPEDGKDDAPVQNVVYAHRAVLAARTQYDFGSLRLRVHSVARHSRATACSSLFQLALLWVSLK
jgi:hypothetical protein